MRFKDIFGSEVLSLAEEQPIKSKGPEVGAFLRCFRKPTEALGGWRVLGMGWEIGGQVRKCRL